MKLVFLVLVGAASCAGPHDVEPGTTDSPPLVVQSADALSAPVVVMSGLVSPRGLAFGPQGALYVAEAGRGPSDPTCFAHPQECSCTGPEFGGTFCYGPTGAVSRLWHGEQERVATGLPSYANSSGRAEGPNDVAMLGVGSLHVTIGLENSPLLRDAMAAVHPEWAGFGQLVHVAASGQWRFVVDVSAYEAAVNPHPRIIDSNPFGLLALPNGHILTDAGGNSVLRVAANGDITTLAVLPAVSSNNGDAVPTSIAVGPDGAYYVGVLTGAPFSLGAASVFRFVPGEAPQPVFTGFRTIIDIAFDADDNLYVVEHSSSPPGFSGTGSLNRVAPNGTRTTVLGGLIRPTSVAIGPDGAIYVTNNGLSLNSGEVLRLEP